MIVSLFALLLTLLLIIIVVLGSLLKNFRGANNYYNYPGTPGGYSHRDSSIISPIFFISLVILALFVYALNGGITKLLLNQEPENLEASPSGGRLEPPFESVPASPFEPVKSPFKGAIDSISDDWGDDDKDSLKRVVRTFKDYSDLENYERRVEELNREVVTNQRVYNELLVEKFDLMDDIDSLRDEKILKTYRSKLEKLNLEVIVIQKALKNQHDERLKMRQAIDSLIYDTTALRKVDPRNN
jgi:hypothetical protein